MITPDKKILITGCGGMLGSSVYEVLAPRAQVTATDIDLNESWLSHLDVRDKAEVTKVVAEVNPDYIIHLAALTDMEYCEKNIENSYKTNIESVQFLSREALARGIPFVYISTAGIFDGYKDHYVETDIGNPASVYGASKYYGELVARSIPKSIVLRAGWMMGGGPKKDKKFINKIIQQIVAGKKELSAVSDKYGVPCYTRDMAKAIEFLLDNEKYGVFHGACDGSTSRYEVACELVKLLGAEGVTVNSVTSNNFGTDYFAPRPSSEVLLNTDLKTLAPAITRPWEEALADYIGRYDWGVKSS